MKISSRSSLGEVAACVAEALAAAGISTVLTGGACASLSTPCRSGALTHRLMPRSTCGLLLLEGSAELANRRSGRHAQPGRPSRHPSMERPGGVLGRLRGVHGRAGTCAPATAPEQVEAAGAATSSERGRIRPPTGGQTATRKRPLSTQAKAMTNAKKGTIQWGSQPSRGIPRAA